MGGQDVFFPFFPHKLSITFVLHAFFSSDKLLQEILFQNHPPPPPSRVKWSAPNGDLSLAITTTFWGGCRFIVFHCFYLPFLKATSWPMFWSPVGGDGALPYERSGMLVFSLRGVNFDLWCHLACSGQNAIVFSRKGLFHGCKRRNIKKLYIFNSFYLLDSCTVEPYSTDTRLIRTPATDSFVCPDKKLIYFLFIFSHIFFLYTDTG